GRKMGFYQALESNQSVMCNLTCLKSMRQTYLAASAFLSLSHTHTHTHTHTVLIYSHHSLQVSKHRLEDTASKPKAVKTRKRVKMDRGQDKRWREVKRKGVSS